MLPSKSMSIYTERVEDIMLEAGLKKQVLQGFMNDFDCKYKQMLTGLDNMEKAIRIDQEQNNVLLKMKKLYVTYYISFMIDSDNDIYSNLRTFKTSCWLSNQH